MLMLKNWDEGCTETVYGMDDNNFTLRNDSTNDSG